MKPIPVGTARNPGCQVASGLGSHPLEKAL